MTVAVLAMQFDRGGARWRARVRLSPSPLAFWRRPSEVVYLGRDASWWRDDTGEAPPRAVGAALGTAWRKALGRAK